MDWGPATDGEGVWRGERVVLRGVAWRFKTKLGKGKRLRGDEAGDEGMGALEFARVRLDFVPDEVQASVLESQHGRGILNCSRQWGKSTVAAVKAIHRACSVREATVLVASPSRRQSAEFLTKTKRLMRGAGMAVKGDGANELSVAFPNGARIVGLPGVEGTVRGFSAVSLLSKAFDNWSYAEHRFMRSTTLDTMPAAHFQSISCA